LEDGLRLRLREEIDLADGLTMSYGYEVYRDQERLFWYDDFPHPEDASLASTFPVELLATVDWLPAREGRHPELEEVKAALAEWPGGRDAGKRKLEIFDDRLLGLALERLTEPEVGTSCKSSGTPSRP
jgi:hypothetical protein